jgi:hypothetical protein
MLIKRYRGVFDFLCAAVPVKSLGPYEAFCYGLIRASLPL